MYMVLCTVIVAVSMVMLDQTILPVALITIQKDLHTSGSLVYWTVEAYLLSIAIFTLAGGRLADIFGQRRIFSLGIVFFALGSVCCAVSPTIEALIVSRFIQGIGGALLLPPGVPLLLAAFPDTKKGFAVGLQTACSSFFLILGPFIGGFLGEHLSWRYIFWINLPVALIGFVMTFLFIPKSLGIKQRFDFKGFTAYSISIILVTVGLIQVPAWGWKAPQTILMCGMGLVFLVFLYRVDSKSKDPFIDFGLFKNLIFKASSMNIFAGSFALMITIFLPMYLQNVLLFSPSQAGLYMALTSIPLVFASPLAGKLLDRFGFQTPIYFGQAVTILAFLWIIVFLPHNQFSLLIPALLALSVGFTSLLTASFSAGISAISWQNRGLASGILGTLRVVGATLGVAATGSVITGTEVSLLQRRLHESCGTSSIAPDLAEQLVESRHSMEILSSLPETTRQLISTYSQEAQLFAFSNANILQIMVIGIACVSMFVLFGKNKR
jgi:EmrB/QacA subfamily drug resistance transporter